VAAEGITPYTLQHCHDAVTAYETVFQFKEFTITAAQLLHCCFLQARQKGITKPNVPFTARSLLGFLRD